MNFTISSLLLSRSFSVSPLFTSGKKNFQIINSNFNYFSSQVVNSRNLKLLVRKTDFSRFTTSALTISQKIVDQQIITEAVESKDEHFTVIQCRFKNILSEEGAIVYFMNKNQGSLTVQSTSFIYCVSNKQSGSISFSGNLFTLKMNCFTECGSRSGRGSIIGVECGHQTKISNNHFYKVFENSEAKDIIYVT